MGNFVIRTGGITSFFFLFREKQRLTGRLISKADRQVTGAIGNWDSSQEQRQQKEKRVCKKKSNKEQMQWDWYWVCASFSEIRNRALKHPVIRCDLMWHKETGNTKQRSDRKHRQHFRASGWECCSTCPEYFCKNEGKTRVKHLLTISNLCVVVKKLREWAGLSNIL